MNASSDADARMPQETVRELLSPEKSSIVDESWNKALYGVVIDDTDNGAVEAKLVCGSATAITDAASGGFCLFLTSTRSEDIEVVADAYAPVRRKSPESSDRVIDLGQIRMPPSRVLNVAVRHHYGHFIEGASVMFSGVDGLLSDAVQIGTTQSDGILGVRLAREGWIFAETEHRVTPPQFVDHVASNVTLLFGSVDARLGLRDHITKKPIPAVSFLLERVDVIPGEQVRAVSGPDGIVSASLCDGAYLVRPLADQVKFVGPHRVDALSNSVLVTLRETASAESGIQWIDASVDEYAVVRLVDSITWAPLTTAGVWIDPYAGGEAIVPDSALIDGRLLVPLQVVRALLAQNSTSYVVFWSKGHQPRRFVIGELFPARVRPDDRDYEVALEPRAPWSLRFLRRDGTPYIGYVLVAEIANQSSGTNQIIFEGNVTASSFVSSPRWESGDVDIRINETSYRHVPAPELTPGARLFVTIEPSSRIIVVNAERESQLVACELGRGGQYVPGRFVNGNIEFELFPGSYELSTIDFARSFPARAYFHKFDRRVDVADGKTYIIQWSNEWSTCDPLSLKLDLGSVPSRSIIAIPLDQPSGTNLVPSLIRRLSVDTNGRVPAYRSSRRTRGLLVATQDTSGQLVPIMRTEVGGEFQIPAGQLRIGDSSPDGVRIPVQVSFEIDTLGEALLSTSASYLITPGEVIPAVPTYVTAVNVSYSVNNRRVRKSIPVRILEGECVDIIVTFK